MLRKNFLASLCLAGGVSIARAEPPAEPAAPPEPVLARFEGGAITQRDMEQAIAVKAPIVRAPIATPAGRERFLRELVDWDLLVLEAVRRGYAEHPVVVAETRKAAIDAMIARDLAPSPASISRAEIQRRYEEDASFYRRPAMRHAAHVELATQAEARALAVELATATREVFARAAAVRSKNARTRRQGGELGWFTREGKGDAGQDVGVPPELVTAAFAATSANAVLATPIAHAGGFSVLMVAGEKLATAIPLERAEASIRAELVEAHTTRALDALFEKLRAEHAPAVLHPELLPLVGVETSAPDVLSGFPAAPPDPREPTRLAPPDDM